MSRTIIVALVTGAVGLGVGLLMRPAPVEHTMTRVQAAQPSPAPALERAELAGMIRGIVQEELARALPRTQTAADPARDKEPARVPPSEPTAQQTQAFEHGQDLIESARHAGRWNEDDRQHLREVLVQVDEGQREELLKTLIPAINRQEIKPGFRGAPF